MTRTKKLMVDHWYERDKFEFIRHNIPNVVGMKALASTPLFRDKPDWQLFRDVNVANAMVIFADIGVNNEIIPDHANLLTLYDLAYYVWGENEYSNDIGRRFLTATGFLVEDMYPSKYSLDNNLMIWLQQRDEKTGMYHYRNSMIYVTSKGQYKIKETIKLAKDSEDYKVFFKSLNR